MRGLAAAWLDRGTLARLLWPLSLLYGCAWGAYRALHRLGWRRRERLPVPVVVVGNLIAGGAGKTPTVMAVVGLLRRAGWTPGVVSRGYGRRERTLREVAPTSTAREVGDEPLLIHLRTHAPLVVGRDRVAAARLLLQRHPDVDVVVSDDGLQHLALARDVSVIVFDERGAGNGWLLPAGPLREPMPATPPPASLVLYNASAPSTPLAGHLTARRLAGAVGLEGWWGGEPPSTPALQRLAGRPLLAVAGLARPQRFFDMLRAAGLQVDTLPLPDHHAFDTLPWPAGTAEVVLTEKDAAKLRPERLRTLAAGAPPRVWVAALDFEPDAGFARALSALLPRANKT